MEELKTPDTSGDSHRSEESNLGFELPESTIPVRSIFESGTLSFQDFTKTVHGDVGALAKQSETPYEFNPTGPSWKRGALTARIGEHFGKAVVAFSAPPSGPFGHRSQGFTVTMDTDGAQEAARMIASFLNNPNWYS